MIKIEYSGGKKKYIALLPKERKSITDLAKAGYFREGDKISVPTLRRHYGAKTRKFVDIVYEEGQKKSKLHNVYKILDNDIIECHLAEIKKR